MVRIAGIPRRKIVRSGAVRAGRGMGSKNLKAWWLMDA